MDYIKVNGISIPYANDVSMGTEPNIVSEITMLSGDVKADINGWRYSDITLNWDYLTPNDLTILLSETDPMNGTFSFTFIDAEYGEKTINAIRKGGVQKKTQFKHIDGKPVFSNISLNLSFPDCYH